MFNVEIGYIHTLFLALHIIFFVILNPTRLRMRKEVLDLYQQVS